MARLVSLFLILGLWGVGSGLWTCQAQPTNLASRVDYDSFRLITDRNIFNPRRFARSGRSEQTTTREVQADSLALVGTMSYEKGLFAFFDGTSSEYRKVLKQEDTIAGFKIAEVQPAYVKLASSTNQLELRVGMQLRHGDDGEWQVSERAQNSSPPDSKGASRGPGRAGVDRQPSGQVALSSTNRSEIEAQADSGQPIGIADPQEPAPATEAPAAAASGGDDVLERLRRRAAAERGENPQ